MIWKLNGLMELTLITFLIFLNHEAHDNVTGNEAQINTTLHTPELKSQFSLIFLQPCYLSIMLVKESIITHSGVNTATAL